MGSGKKGQKWPAVKKTARFTLSQSIELGRSLLVEGDQVSAEHVLTTILAALPNEPDALHLLGALRNMQLRPVEALPLLQKAAELKPSDPGRWNDLGLVFGKLAHDEEAMAAYRRCATLAGHSPLTAKALDNLGRLQLKQDAFAAEATFREALAMDPGNGLPWYGLAQALVHQDKLGEGLQASGQAVRLLPSSMARELFAMALVRRGYSQTAIEFYQKWLQDDPLNPLIKHHLKALLTPESAERASDAYIESTFDHFAKSFDVTLAQLNYCAPQWVCEALQQVYPHPRADLDIADAGCGTGLCGPLVRPWARQLCGFDLSAGMLAQAKVRKVYDKLLQAELVGFLKVHPGAFDVVILADTLCYFGNLDQVMAVCAGAVRPGGHVIFTVEALEDDDLPHRLAPTGRYAHRHAHVSKAAQDAGWLACATTSMILRLEGGTPVKGWLVTLKRPLHEPCSEIEG